MRLDDPARLEPADQAVPELAVRRLGADEAALHAQTAAAGFGQDVDCFLRLLPPPVMSAYGLRAYVGEADGQIVTTALGVTRGDAVGVFNVATRPSTAATDTAPRSPPARSRTASRPARAGRGSRRARRAAASTRRSASRRSSAGAAGCASRRRTSRRAARRCPSCAWSWDRAARRSPSGRARSRAFRRSAARTARASRRRADPGRCQGQHLLWVAAVGFSPSSATWSFPLTPRLLRGERLVRRDRLHFARAPEEDHDLVAERLLEVLLEGAPHVARRLEDHVAARPERRHLLGPGLLEQRLQLGARDAAVAPQVHGADEGGVPHAIRLADPATGRSLRVHGLFTARRARADTFPMQTTGRLLFMAAVTCYLLGRVFAGRRRTPRRSFTASRRRSGSTS